ncbi:hypothetical protein M3Y95_01246500 [Aphelenchoides besseyi]|nr:hypothetical protein M3Y95_01246500 [Aphelenchoides besseyi]
MAKARPNAKRSQQPAANSRNCTRGETDQWLQPNPMRSNFNSSRPNSPRPLSASAPLNPQVDKFFRDFQAAHSSPSSIRKHTLNEKVAALFSLQPIQWDVQAPQTPSTSDSSPETGHLFDLSQKSERKEVDVPSEESNFTSDSTVKSSLLNSFLRQQLASPSESNKKLAKSLLRWTFTSSANASELRPLMSGIRVLNSDKEESKFEVQLPSTFAYQQFFKGFIVNSMSIFLTCKELNAWIRAMELTDVIFVASKYSDFRTFNNNFQAKNVHYEVQWEWWTTLSTKQRDGEMAAIQDFVSTLEIDSRFLMLRKWPLKNLKTLKLKNSSFSYRLLSDWEQNPSALPIERLILTHEAPKFDLLREFPDLCLTLHSAELPFCEHEIFPMAPNFCQDFGRQMESLKMFAPNLTQVTATSECELEFEELEEFLTSKRVLGLSNLLLYLDKKTRTWHSPVSHLNVAITFKVSDLPTVDGAPCIPFTFQNQLKDCMKRLRSRADGICVRYPSVTKQNPVCEFATIRMKTFYARYYINFTASPSTIYDYNLKLKVDTVA